MDTVLSFLISVGIIAFGVWIVAGTIAAGSLLGWTLMGMIPVAMGLISLFSEFRSDKTA
jgi:Zn-dependent protease with chaperone function